MAKRPKKRPVRQQSRRAKSPARKRRVTSPSARRSRASPDEARNRGASPSLTPLSVARARHLDDGEPPRERDGHEDLIPGASSDDLAEELGEEFVETATSGEQAAEDIRDEEVPEEEGGPFVETSAKDEFAYDTDESNPEDAEPSALPVVSAVRQIGRTRS